MDTKEFKLVFGKIAKSRGFQSAFNCYYKLSEESAVVLELQKSNYSNLYYINIKITLKSVTGTDFKINKENIANERGSTFRRTPVQYDNFLNLETVISNDIRINGIEEIFDNFIVPFTQEALSNLGILRLSEKGKISLGSYIEELLLKSIT